MSLFFFTDILKCKIILLFDEKQIFWESHYFTTYYSDYNSSISR